MNYSNKCTDTAITKALDKAGAFFAFSNERFDELKETGVNYMSLGAGLMCPRNKAEALIVAISNITKKRKKKNLKENGKEKIIARELSNYEAYYTGDISDTVDALAGYNFTREEILKVYKKQRRRITTL